MFWFEVDEHFKNDHFFIFLLHNWNLKESVHEKLIFTPIGIRITVGVSTLVVGTGCTHFNYKIYIRIGWEFVSPHRTLSLIEYLDHIVQNSRIQISVDQIPDFRSDSWENDRLHINIVWILSMQWPSKSTRDRKNTQNIVLLMNPLQRLRGNNLAPKHRFWTYFKTRFTYLTLRFSHYFGGIYHVSQWSILQIVVRSQHTTWYWIDDMISYIVQDSKYDRCTTYWKSGPRFYTISTPNIHFGIMP